jgi:hypothetical protein
MTTSQVSTTRSAIAWAGGVAFAVSLLWCFLAILFGMPESGVPDTPAFTFAVINFVLFTLFAAHHSLFARTGIKRWITSHVPPELERSAYVWISSLLLILVCIAWRPLPGVAYAHYGAVAIVHWLIVVAGFWLTFRSASVLDPPGARGIRQATGQEFTSEFKLDRAVLRRAAPDLSGLAADRLRCAGDDLDAPRVRRRQLGVPGVRDSVRGAHAGRRVR